MEESEKRKERLRAMLTGAAQAENVDGQFNSTAPAHLFNPLTQPSATPPGAGSSPPTARFDYYTDPTSAYSGNKRSSRLGPRPRDNFSSPVRGGSPMAHLPSPSSGQGRQYMTPAPPANHFQASYSPHQGPLMTPLPVPYYGHWRPVGMAGPFLGHTTVSMPGLQDRSDSSSGYGPPCGASRGILASPGFGRGVSPSANSGRGSPSVSSRRGISSANSGRGSPSVNSGRGSPSVNSGRGIRSASSGRGSTWRSGSYQNSCLGKHEIPDCFFNKKMVLDPWDRSEPVVGCILQPQVRHILPDESWHPESIKSKKAKVTETVSVSRSQGSLAEYIALAFEEAANDETV